MIEIERERVRQPVEGHLRLVSNVPRRRRAAVPSRWPRRAWPFSAVAFNSDEHFHVARGCGTSSSQVARSNADRNWTLRILTLFKMLVLQLRVRRLSAKERRNTDADDGRDEGGRHENKKGSHQLSSH